MDRLAAMEAFVRVIEAGSFSGAAKQLRVGQPAVSKTIAQLEDRLGVRLLLRSTHGLTPTDAGRDFYEHAKRSIEDVRDRKSTRLNSSHSQISYAVFCLKKKNKMKTPIPHTSPYATILHKHTTMRPQHTTMTPKLRSTTAPPH